MVEPDVVGDDASVGHSPVALGDQPGDGAFDRGPPSTVFVLPGGVGGGLAAGTALTLAARSPSTTFYLAEPAGAAETYESLRRGERVTQFTPDTICDGLRGTLGAPNFAMLHAHGTDFSEAAN